jgi:prepilin-type N-terminal cleavage/methylation domain-containing protein
MSANCRPSAHNKGPLRRLGAFTLVEIMVVVVLVGVLAALALPLHYRLSTRSQTARFQNDLRVASQAIEVYTVENGDWPPDGGGGWPEAVMDYLPAPARWSLPTPVGGQWSWSRDAAGVAAALRVTGHKGGETLALELDRLIDDGNLTAGLFRGTSDELLYILQE